MLWRQPAGLSRTASTYQRKGASMTARTSHTRPPRPPDFPTLRLFDPPHEERDDPDDLDPRDQRPPTEPSPLWSLSEFFERLFVANYLRERSADPKTEASYRESLNWFVTLIGDLPLNQITRRHTREFRVLLASCCSLRGRRPRAIDGLSSPQPLTVRKHCQQLGKVLKFAGPSDDDDEHIALLASPPKVPKPHATTEPPDGDFTLAEIRALLAATDKMRSPKGAYLAGPLWWHSIVLIACYTGLRIGTLTQTEWRMIGETYAVLPSRIFKGRRKGQRVFLHPQARETLAAIKPADLEAQPLVFPWPHNVRYLHAQRERLTRLAGLPPHRRFGFHGFRRYQTTAIYEAPAGLSDADALALAQQSANHSSASTTAGHYINGAARDRKLAAAIAALPSILEAPPSSPPAAPLEAPALEAPT